MSELDKLIIEYLETTILKEKLTKLDRHIEAFDYVMTEIDLLTDIYYLITNDGGYTHNTAIKHIDLYLENNYEVNMNCDKTQIIRAIKISNII